MCLLFFQTKDNPSENEYKLVLANVRDEMLIRPTKSADWWKPSHPTIIGGKKRTNKRKKFI